MSRLIEISGLSDPVYAFMLFVFSDAVFFLALMMNILFMRIHFVMY